MSSTPPPERSYGGLSQDVRREQRRARLVEAALDQVGAGGLSSLTVAAVCTRAGLAKRYFYESFASVDDLVVTALGRVFTQVGEALASAEGGGARSPAVVLEDAVRSALAVMDDSRAARLYLESAGLPGAAATRAAAVDALVGQLLGQVVGPGAPSPSARLVGHLLVSGSTHVVALWLQGDLDLSRDEVVRLLAEVGAAAAERLRSEAGPHAEAP